MWRSFLLAVMVTGTSAALGAQEPASPPQGTAHPGPAAGVSQNAPPTTAQSESIKTISDRDRRRAAKLFLEAGKLFEKEQYEPAMHDYEQASALDPANPDYPLAAKVARSHPVVALIQAAAKARLTGNAEGTRAALQQALELDPNNAEVTEHLQELADDALLGQVKPLYDEGASTAGEAPILAHSREIHSFHLRTDQRQLIQTVFKSYGIQATLDQSIPPNQVKLDLDDVSFDQAVQALSMVTKSF